MTKNKTSTKKGTSTEKKVHVDNSKVHTLDKRISSLESEKEELKKTIQFVQAEFENYKKRQDRDFDNRVNLSSSNIITKILPILDDFEHSISNMKSQNNTTDETIQGVEIIYNNILNILNNGRKFLKEHAPELLDETDEEWEEEMIIARKEKHTND